MFEPSGRDAARGFAAERAALEPGLSSALPFGDDLAAKYSALAGDGSQGPKSREAAMLLSAAENSLIAEDDISTATSKASQALNLFREAGDANAVADALRLLVNVRAEGEGPKAASDLAIAELQKFSKSGDRRGEASMRLSLAEVAARHPAGDFSGERGVEAFQHARAAVEFFEGSKDARMHGIALLALAHCHMTQAVQHDSRQEIDSALQVAKDAAAAFQRADERRGQAKALHAQAAACAHAEDVDDAVRHGKQALALWRDLGLAQFEGMELRCLAEWLRAADQADEALKMAEAAHKIFEKIGNRRGWEAAAMVSVARAHLEVGAVETAHGMAKDAIRAYESTADEAGEVAAMSLMVDVQLAQDNGSEALGYAERCLEALRALRSRTAEDHKFEASLLHSVAQIHMAQESFDKAATCCKDSVRIFKDAGDDLNANLVLHTLSNVHIGLGEYREAIKAASEARDFFRKRGHKRGHAFSCLQCASAFAARGEHNRGIAMGREASAIFMEEGHQHGTADAQALLGEVYLARGNAKKSMIHAREAREICKELGRSQKELESLFTLTKGSFVVASEGVVPQTAKEKPSAEWDAALALGQEALALARKSESTPSIVAALFSIGQIFVVTKKASEASKIIDEALPLAQEMGDDRAVANLEILTAQMHFIGGEESSAPEPAKRALEIFREKLGDTDGVDACNELIRFVEGGGAMKKADEAVEEGADSGAAGAVAAYEGPAVEDISATISDLALSLMGVESLAGDTPLMDAGLDSLASVEFQNNISKEFKVQLPSTLVFDYPSVNTMTDFLNTSLRQAAGFAIEN
uniref:Carrier domain-containing protein n=1 Tax=Zooxanthella nutricula TaxID=1333877 RepID=A0A7S2L8V5_9DINO